PTIIASPVLTTVSHATRASLSSLIISSKIASEIWSATLSGCPSVTDSDVNNLRSIYFLLNYFISYLLYYINLFSAHIEKATLFSYRSVITISATFSTILLHRRGCWASQGVLPPPTLDKR